MITFSLWKLITLHSICCLKGRCYSQADDFWFWDFAYNDAGKVRAFRSFFKIMNVDNSLKDDILQVENVGNFRSNWSSTPLDM